MTTLGSATLKETAVASAATCDIGATPTEAVNITGAVTITSFGSAPWKHRSIRFSGALTLTNSASLILPGGASIITAAGDTAIARSDGSGNWRVYDYSRAATPPPFAAAVTTNALAAIVSMPAAGTYYDGPTVTLAPGVWFVAGSITITAAPGDLLGAKLHDGTTVVASAVNGMNTGGWCCLSLCGVIANPAGPVKISAKNVGGTSGSIMSDGSGAGKDSNITAYRIG